MYSSISLGLKSTKNKIPGNIVERLWHISNVAPYEDTRFATIKSPIDDVKFSNTIQLSPK
jgi:hypothetical protein